MRLLKGTDVPYADYFYHDACVLEILAVDNTRKLISEIEEIVHDEPMSIRKLQHKMCISAAVLNHLVELSSCLWVDHDKVKYKGYIDD